MTWTVHLAKDAARQLKRLPRDRRQLLLTRLRAMQDDPLHGDIKPLKGREWRGWYRRRVGRYRIIFSLRRNERIVDISAILLREDTTYQ